MSRYSINGEILTDIADAIRGKGKLYEPIGEPQIACTPGADPDNGMWYNGEEGWNMVEHVFVFKIPGASKYKFNLRTKNFNNNAFYYAPGEWDTKPADAIQVKLSLNVYDYEWEVVGDVVTLFYKDYLMVETDGGYGFYLTVYGFSNTITPEEMATEIDALQVIPSDLLTWKGNCAYKNYGGAWDDFINYFGDRITTKEVSSLSNGFQNSPLKKIPFEINFSNAIATDLSRAFYGCEKLEEAPIINNPKVNNTSYMFAYCKDLREFPEDYGENWDWSYLAETTSSYDGYCEQMFANCYSLRKLPMALYKYRNPKTGYRYTSLRNMEGLYALDEIIDFPYPYTETVTGTGSSSPFYYAFRNCYRLKNFTFASDIGPKNWSNQTLDMTICVGWANYVNDCCSYNSGIDIFDHRVSDDASYQALKNDPNWFTGDVAYSRYNHDSAVATINSLPDCSAYQTANNKVANTIKFKGVAGEKTDGGAINTLTDEEIAVAAAKGWTVTLT